MTNPSDRATQQGKLRSLWEMYDFCLLEFHDVMASVAVVHQSTKALEDRRDASALTAEACDHLIGVFEKTLELCQRLNLSHSAHRAEWALKRLRDRTMTGPNLRSDTASLHEGMMDDASKIFCYHYPPLLAEPLVLLEVQWDATLRAFPSAAEDIRAGVDLYALGHATASVFHMMRASELALRVLAKERRVSVGKNKPLEWAQWGTLLGKLEEKRAELLNKTNGPKKDAALEFYSTAIGHMIALKDKYRDQVNHVRRSYDLSEAKSAMDHVRECMNGLATRLSEKSTRAIAWGL